MSKKPSPSIQKPFVLWPNGGFFKTIVFPFILIDAVLFYQAITGNSDWQGFLIFSAVIAVPFLLLAVPFRFVVNAQEIAGPELGRTFRRSSVAVRNAQFFLDEKIWGFPSFRIKDKTTQAEIGSFYLYFSKGSLVYLKSLVEGR